MGFQSSLIKYHDIADLLLEFISQFGMKRCLAFPNSLKLIKIILPIEHFVFCTEMRILLNIRIKVLPNSLFVEIQFLTPITDLAKITA